METLTSYDLVPYESMPSPACHPDRLFTMGRLFGLNPKPVTHCRVLELGCSDGGHLLPMALTLPESEFIGIDLSARQIEMGRAALKALDVSNLTLEHTGIMDVDDRFGAFDYIICHGVFSWVPGEVQEKILAIFADRLTDHGLAYVDYNTYPGWCAIEPLRHLMQFHTKGLTDPQATVGQALSILDLLEHFIQTEDRDYAAFIKKEIERTKKVGGHMAGGAYVFHEYLEETNTPLYFHQFARMAGRHGLQYLGEATYANMLTHGFPDQLADLLAGLGDDVVQLEQYMDFLRNRRFRQSLLCRQGPVLHRDIDPQDLMTFQIACTKNVDDQVLAMTGGGPLVQTALKTLVDHRPRVLPFDVLFQETAGILAVPLEETDAARLELAQNLARLYPLNVIQLRSWQAPFTIHPGDRPRLCPLALYQARQGQRWLSNRCHETAVLPLPLHRITAMLDGHLGRRQLADDLKNQIEQGAISVSDAQADLPMDLAGPRQFDPDQVLDLMLKEIAQKALLVA